MDVPGLFWKDTRETGTSVTSGEGDPGVRSKKGTFVYICTPSWVLGSKPDPIQLCGPKPCLSLSFPHVLIGL